MSSRLAGGLAVQESRFPDSPPSLFPNTTHPFNLIIIIVIITIVVIIITPVIIIITVIIAKIIYKPIASSRLLILVKTSS